MKTTVTPDSSSFTEAIEDWRRIFAGKYQSLLEASSPPPMTKKSKRQTTGIQPIVSRL